MTVIFRNLKSGFQNDTSGFCKAARWQDKALAMFPNSDHRNGKRSRC
jgi:hypothetical protein